MIAVAIIAAIILILIFVMSYSIKRYLLFLETKERENVQEQMNRDLRMFLFGGFPNPQRMPRGGGAANLFEMQNHELFDMLEDFVRIGIDNVDGEAPDAQNSHDTHVNKHLTKRYHRILDLNESHKRSSEETIQAELIGLAASLEKPIDVIEKYIALLKKGYTISSIPDKVGKPSKEADIFKNAWLRAETVVPETKELDLKTAIVNAIIDAHPENIFLCINGRVARVLSAFTLIDPDKEISEPERTFKDIEKDVYNFAASILDKYAQKYPVLYKCYTKLRRTNEEEKRAIKFITRVKLRIGEKITNDYSKTVSAEELQTLKDNANAAIDV